MHTRLLSALDSDKGKFQFPFLEPKVLVPKNVEDYKASMFSFHTKQIHPIDQIEFHKKAGEMLYSTMKNKVMILQKLQNTLANIRDQIRLEKESSHTKDNRIKSLEDLVIEVGFDPSNVQVVDELIKNKNADIAALKKQVKLPPIEHPQAKEVLQDTNKKD